MKKSIQITENVTYTMKHPHGESIEVEINNVGKVIVSGGREFIFNPSDPMRVRAIAELLITAADKAIKWKEKQK